MTQISLRPGPNQTQDISNRLRSVAGHLELALSGHWLLPFMSRRVAPSVF